jgi:hypothetical protein
MHSFQRAPDPHRAYSRDPFYFQRAGLARYELGCGRFRADCSQQALTAIAAPLAEATQRSPCRHLAGDPSNRHRILGVRACSQTSSPDSEGRKNADEPETPISRRRGGVGTFSECE